MVFFFECAKSSRDWNSASKLKARLFFYRPEKYPFFRARSHALSYLFSAQLPSSIFGGSAASVDRCGGGDDFFNHFWGPSLSPSVRSFSSQNLVSSVPHFRFPPPHSAAEKGEELFLSIVRPFPLSFHAPPFPLKNRDEEKDGKKDALSSSSLTFCQAKEKKMCDQNSFFAFFLCFSRCCLREVMYVRKPCMREKIRIWY